MIKPNYKSGSIVNLMSSIIESSGGNNAKLKDINSKYPPLKELNSKVLGQKKNLILLVIDGLGYEYLQKYGQDSFLFKNNKSRLTSVFPPTTASAITTFRTGIAPSDHAITGWYVYYKELGFICAPLPFTARGAGIVNTDPKYIFKNKTTFEKIKRKSYIVTSDTISDSIYSSSFKGTGENRVYSTLNGLFRQIKKVMKENTKKKKYIYAYWPNFDSLCHHFGTNHKEVHNHFLELDKKIKALSKSIENSNTTLIITSDHGLINCPKSGVVNMEDHPRLRDCLLLPLSGEPRAAYCYIRLGKEQTFKNYIKKHFKDICYLFKSKEFVKKGFFGAGPVNPDLYDRIGDYTLILKEDYIIKDRLLGNNKVPMKGNHGGVSPEEMYVPLIVIGDY